jgi:hypothetical protein
VVLEGLADQVELIRVVLHDQELELLHDFLGSLSDALAP